MLLYRSSRLTNQCKKLQAIAAIATVSVFLASECVVISLHIATCHNKIVTRLKCIYHSVLRGGTGV